MHGRVLNPRLSLLRTTSVSSLPSLMVAVTGQSMGVVQPAGTRLPGRSSAPERSTTMPKINKTASAERLQFVEPMYARAVQQLPEGKDWLYEVKFDDYRCLAGSDSTGVTLWSRRAKRLTTQFPSINEACKHLPADTLLDGELIALDKNGRVSFNMLQHHRSQAQAILFYAFDVIIHRGRSHRHVPLEIRRELLSDIAGDLKMHTPLIGLSDTLDTTPAELIPLIKEFGFEGIVASAKTPVIDWQAQWRMAQVQG
jgi:ATP-dependent DNA ligase